MTLIIQKPTGAKLNLAKTNNGIVDPDAIIYINNVEKADGQNLEYNTAKAIHDFVVGCKTDGIWNAIKSSCILAGARTLSGALIPLSGLAPTNLNFAAGDYDRKTGLLGDGASKALNTNRPTSADVITNFHISVYATSRDSLSGRYISAGGGGATVTVVGNTTGFRIRFHSSTLTSLGTGDGVPLFLGANRASSASYTWRYATQSGTQSVIAGSNTAGNYFVFSSNVPAEYTSARIAFYSIGESLDLALLDARVTTLINAFAAAIP
jgi:hypothetical protein